MFLSGLKDIVEFTAWRNVAFAKLLTKAILTDLKLNYWKVSFSHVAVTKSFDYFLVSVIINYLGYGALYCRDKINLILFAFCTTFFT